jgi:hypothetical protein
MSQCLFCREAAALGALCSSHAQALVGCREITAGQIISRHDDMPEPTAWLVDQWGRSHALASVTLLGRDHEQCSIAVMHHSVSGRHARLDIADSQQPMLRDLGSLNGTYVNQTRMREARLCSGDRVALGEVIFYFTTRPAPARSLPPGIGATVPTRAGSLAVAFRFTSQGRSAELRQRVGGGVVRTGAHSLDLAPLEFALLRVLAERALRASDPELGFVATEILLRGLDFRTLDPSSDNLRELVRRLRRKLGQVGIDRLIVSKRGAGYRLGWSVASLDSE